MVSIKNSPAPVKADEITVGVKESLEYYPELSESDLEEEFAIDQNNDEELGEGIIELESLEGIEQIRNTLASSSKHGRQVEEMIAEFMREIDASGNWQSSPALVHQDTLKVCASTRPGANFCFRVEAELSAASAPHAFDLFYDLKRRPEWDSMCEGVEIIDQIDPFTFIYHLKLKGVWPTAPRDSVLLVSYRRLDVNRFVSVARSIDDSRVPPDPSGKVVRMHTKLAGNLMINIDKSTMKLIQLADADPKGYIPSSLVKHVSTKSFPASINKLQAVLASTQPASKTSKMYHLAVEQLLAAIPATSDTEKLLQSVQALQNKLDNVERELDSLRRNFENDAISPLGRWVYWVTQVSPLVLTSVALIVLLRDRRK